LRDSKATKIINKNSWIPELEKILKEPNKYEAGVLTTHFCCCVFLSSSFEEKGPLILYQFPFRTNFNQQLFNHTHTHTCTCLICRSLLHKTVFINLLSLSLIFIFCVRLFLFLYIRLQLHSSDSHLVLTS